MNPYSDISQLVYWVQISGASLLGAEELASGDFIPGSPSDQVWDDLDGIDALRSLIRKFESRAVDNYLLDVAKNTPHIKTAVVLPPIIYGRGEGPVHQVSVQIPALSRVALEKGHAVRVGRGLSRWGNVHVKDIARLFTLLAVAGVEGNNDDKIWGENGLYLPGIGKEIVSILSLYPSTQHTNPLRTGPRSQTESLKQLRIKELSSPPTWRSSTRQPLTRHFPPDQCSSVQTRGASPVVVLSCWDGRLQRRVWTLRFRGLWQKRLRTERVQRFRLFKTDE